MMNVEIGKYLIGQGQPIFIVGEIGINHNGNVSTAKHLIDIAVKAGCQAVKFQKRTVPVVYCEVELKRPREVPFEMMKLAVQRGVCSPEILTHPMSESSLETTNGDLKMALEFTEKEYEEIDRHSREKGIMWYASPWDEGSVDFLEKFNPPAYKIASASLTDDELLKYIRSRQRPVILSTGMSKLEEIDHAVEILGKRNLVILHCTSTYPAELEELNLKVIDSLRKRYSVPVGYSGHEKGIYPSIYAAALGACVVERHITVDRTMWGSDQAVSLEPKGLQFLVEAIREGEKALGDGLKRVLNSEVPILKKLRRKIGNP
ncbi:MAG: N-acetylneuraminate synthase family protein [Candidatus Binatia bacterium]